MRAASAETGISTRRIPAAAPRLALWFGLAFVLTLPAVNPRVNASDEVQYFAYLRSAWFDRDVDFENEYRHFYDRGIARTPGFEQTFLQPFTPTGLRENFGTVGAALLWAPFYAVADVLTRAWRAAGSNVPADGYSGPYLAAVAYGSAFYGFVALLLSVAAARRLTGGGGLAALAVWFGTPLLFYMYVSPAFAHACSAFAVAVFVTIWLRVRQRWSTRGIMLLGAAAALMAMVREQDILYALGPAVDYAASSKMGGAWRQHGGGQAAAPRLAAAANRVLPPLAGLATFAVAYTPQLLAYWSLNGRFGPSTLVTRKMTWTAPHAVQVLASPQHGLFVWTPLAALALVGLVLWWVKAARLDRLSAVGEQLAVKGDEPARAAWTAAHDCRSTIADPQSSIADPASPVLDHRRIVGCMLLMFALQVYVSGSVDSWTVAGAFGQRRFVSATILLVIGLAALWCALPHGVPRTLAAAAAALAIWWNIGLMALFGAGLMDRQRLQLRQNAYDVFVTLPRTAPALTYRYFTDRESFYKVRP